ncbi:MAG: lamin tail domain-containing protein [Candidatus Nealsonbacteria bacterium]|nr:lamin tail domain-containing protein [Candidatus Nealsonbacteria bacterium]
MEKNLQSPIKKLFFKRTTGQIFNILLLIFLAGFLVFPKTCLADDVIENITIEEIEKNLELPQGDAQNLMNTFRQVFTTEAMNSWGSGYATDEETVAVLMLLKAAKTEEVNYFFTDAPIETIKNIIKGTIEIAQIVLIKDFSAALDKIEKETVKMAVDYGVRALIDNEIKMSPGAINLKYLSCEGEEREAIFQYVIVFHSLNTGRGNVKIRFYSSDFLEAPSPQKHGSMTSLPAPDLRKDIPPFIVDITGIVEKDQFENYQWVDENGQASHPFIKISFPPTVPDLGINPSTLLERQMLNPIESTIKEFEVIIAKTTGKTLGITDIWNKIKSFISEINFLSPAAIVETKTNAPEPNELESPFNIINQQNEKLSLKDPKKEDLPEEQPKTVEVDLKEEMEKKLTLEEIQEIIDDISEKIDILNQKIIEFKGIDEESEKEVLEVEKIVKDQEEDEEESEIINDSKQKEEIALCEKNGELTKNQVIFNEIAWMGTKNSANDEWIELKNISGNSISLAGWQILNKEKQIKIIFTKEVIPNNGFLLLERTDDNSVPEVTADLIYTGNLNNTNESLYLFDKNCQLQDEATANQNWPAGDNSLKRTMERKIDLNWQSGANFTGTPRAENSAGYYEYVAVGGGGNPAPPQLSPEPILKVLISEIQIASANNTYDEFVELYNPNEQEADISQWSIQKSYSTSTAIYKKNFETGDKIPGKGYFLIVNASSNDQGLLNLADMTHKVFNLAQNNAVYLVKNQEEIEGASDADIVDLVGFGQNVFSENDPAENPPVGKNIDRKWSTTSQNYLDNDNNLVDFEVQIPTPKAQNQSPESGIIPEPHPEESVLSVVINEIAWMGTGPDNSSDEWIELYNNASTSIDLTGWKIKKNGEEFIKISSSTISGSGFYLLERTASNTTDITEDQVYTGELSNVGGKLELINDGDIFIDAVDCSSGWFAGTSSPYYISMERIDSSASGTSSANWENNNLIIRNGRDAKGNNINGTPKAKNSVSMSPISISNLPFDEFSEINLTHHGSPYIIQSSLTIPKEKILKIEKGVILKFFKTGIEIEGKIEALGGEEDEKIVFTSLKDDDFGGDTNGDGPSIGNPGDWDWLYFKESSGSKLKNTIFRYGSSIYGCFPCCACFTRGMIRVENGEILIEDSIIEKSRTVGLWLINSSTTVNNVNFLNIEGVVIDYFDSAAGIYIEGGSPVIKNSKFSGNKFGIKILSGATPKIENNIFENNITPIYFNDASPYFKNNQAINNNLNGIFVGPGYISSTTWQADLPYIIENGAIGGGAVLSLDPGVIVKFKMGPVYKGTMEIYGKILAQGSASNPVIFTSFNDDEYGGDTNNDANNSIPNKGDWYWLHFFTSGSVLDNTIIKYGGSESPLWWLDFGAITVKEDEGDVELTVRNSEIKDNIYGVYVSGPCEKFGNIYLENNIFLNNKYDTNCPWEKLSESRNIFF